MDPVIIHSQTGAVANRSTLRGTLIPLESLVGTRCMNRWDEGSWDNDPHRHGRFTIIAGRGIYALIRAQLMDALVGVPKISYSVQDTMTVQHHSSCTLRIS